MSSFEIKKQKLLHVKRLNGKFLLVLSANIDYVEQVSQEVCRIHVGDMSILVDRDYQWMRKHLREDYDESECHEVPETAL